MRIMVPTLGVHLASVGVNNMKPKLPKRIMELNAKDIKTRLEWREYEERMKIKDHRYHFYRGFVVATLTYIVANVAIVLIIRLIK